MSAKGRTRFDFRQLRVFPLEQRRSLSALDKILVDPAAPAPPTTPAVREQLGACAESIRRARANDASVMLLYGAHLVKNGAMAITNELVNGGWVSHVATNGAGVIHDWELAFSGHTEESVRENVAAGRFGTWEETGRSINLAVLCGGARGEGFGSSIGRFILEDGCKLPSPDELRTLIRDDPNHPLTPARAELLNTLTVHDIRLGKLTVSHPHKKSCISANAFKRHLPFTVHPGIGYDIFTNHPVFSGAAIGRAAAIDYQLFCDSVERLDGGVVLSVGSAIMAPQVFEKSLSAVNNVRLQQGRAIVSGHEIYVVDIQDGGNWDWSGGEPAKDNPAYYLRFCKSFARMGGAMRYLQCDNVAFLHNLFHLLGT